MREDLYGRTNVQISALDGLSGQIGHGNPKFTVAHYDHSLGIFAAAELAHKTEFACDRSLLIAAWYKHTSSVYRYANEGLECIPEHMFRDRFKVQIRKVDQQRNKRANLRRRRSLSPFERSLEFARLLRDPAISLADAIAQTGIDPGTAAELQKDLSTPSSRRRSSGSERSEGHKSKPGQQAGERNAKKKNGGIRRIALGR